MSNEEWGKFCQEMHELVKRADLKFPIIISRQKPDLPLGISDFDWCIKNNPPSMTMKFKMLKSRKPENREPVYINYDWDKWEIKE